MMEFALEPLVRSWRECNFGFNFNDTDAEHPPLTYLIWADNIIIFADGLDVFGAEPGEESLDQGAEKTTGLSLAEVVGSELPDEEAPCEGRSPGTEPGPDWLASHWADSFCTGTGREERVQVG